MEEVDFGQKIIELAQSSQYFIESLNAIGLEVSSLYAPLTSVFSSFYGIFVNIVYVQSSLTKSIQEFTLVRFELLFPFYNEAQTVTPKVSPYFPAQTGKLAFPLLLNVSTVKAVSNVATPLAKKASEVASFPEIQEPEIAKKPEITSEVLEKQSAGIPQKPFVQHIVEVQTQLWSKLTPSLENLSSMLLEYERQTIPLTLLAAASRPVLLNQTGFADLTTYRFVISSEKEPVKPKLPTKTLTIEASPSDLASSRFIDSLETEPVRRSYLQPSTTKTSRELTPHEALTPEAKPSDLTSGTLIPLKKQPVKPSYPPPPTKEVKRKNPADKELTVETKTSPITSDILVPLEKETAKPTHLQSPAKKSTRKPLLNNETAADAAAPNLSTGITLSPETLKVVNYATKLATTISEMQIPFQTIIIPTSQILPASLSFPSAESSIQYNDTTVSVNSTQKAPSQIDLRVEKSSPLHITARIDSTLETSRENTGGISALSIIAASVEKHVAETLIQPISNLKAPQTPEDREHNSGLKSTKLNPDERQTQVEAFRLPSILTSLVTYHTLTYPWLSYKEVSSQTYETPTEVRQFTSETPATMSAKSEVSKTPEIQEYPQLPVRLAIATTEHLLTQKRHATSTAFMKNIQISSSKYASVIADLGATGLVRASMLSELAPGLSTLTTIEPTTPDTQSPIQDTNKPYLSAARPLSPQLRPHITASPSAIKINVFADTEKQDFRDLERKIGRILSEQVADLGATGLVRASMLSELAPGLSTLSTIEPTTPEVSIISQKPPSQGSMHPANQDVVNVNMFADTAEEDLRNLERKIRYIISEQMSRYYGSSRI